MANLDRMTAAPKEIKIGDDKYYISPLRIEEIGKLEKWAEEKIFSRVQNDLAMADKAGVVLNDEFKYKLIKDASKNSRSQAERAKEMESIDGLKKILELSLLIKHKNITPEDVTIIANKYGLENINDVIADLSYPTEEENNEVKK